MPVKSIKKSIWIKKIHLNRWSNVYFDPRLIHLQMIHCYMYHSNWWLHTAIHKFLQSYGLSKPKPYECPLRIVFETYFSFDTRYYWNFKTLILFLLKNQTNTRSMLQLRTFNLISHKNKIPTIYKYMYILGKLCIYVVYL
jgi:hypothetical protein